MVRETGLEPVRCEPHAPQTCASASSATLAKATRYCRQRYYYTDFSAFVKMFFYFFLFILIIFYVILNLLKGETENEPITDKRNENNRAVIYQ